MNALASLIAPIMGWCLSLRIIYLCFQELVAPAVETAPLIFEAVAIFLVGAFLLRYFIGEAEDLNPKKN